jgi:hypothetical protein
MKRKKLTLPQKIFYDLACSHCRHVNIFDALTMCATAFCSQCQAITFHKVSNIRVVTLDDFLQPEPASKEKLYSPDDDKKMGFGKGKK